MARPVAVAWTSARAKRCGFYFDPAKLKIHYLGYERAQGATGEQFAKIEKAYDTSYRATSEKIASEADYCSERKGLEIKADLERHLAGDYTPNLPKPKPSPAAASGAAPVEPGRAFQHQEVLGTEKDQDAAKPRRRLSGRCRSRQPSRPGGSLQRPRQPAPPLATRLKRAWHAARLNSRLFPSWGTHQWPMSVRPNRRCSRWLGRDAIAHALQIAPGANPKPSAGVRGGPRALGAGCPRAGMERSLPPRRPRRPAVPDLQLELALGQSLPAGAPGERSAVACHRDRAPRGSSRHAVAARARAGRGPQGAALDGRAGQPVRGRAGRERAATCTAHAAGLAVHRHPLGADAVASAQGARRRAVAPLLREIGMRQMAVARGALSRSRQRPGLRPLRAALQRQGAQEPPPPVAPTCGAGTVPRAPHGRRGGRAAAPQPSPSSASGSRRPGASRPALADPRFAAFFADVAEGRATRPQAAA